MEVQSNFSEVSVIRVCDAAVRLATSRQNLYLIHRQDPTFPRIFKVGKKNSVLLKHELDAWILARHAASQICPAASGKKGGAA